MKTKEKVLWEVSESGIHNRGLFAAEDIESGTYIIQYLGEKISKEESSRRGVEWEEKARKDGDGLVYIFELDDEYDIDGNVPDNYARLMNHSCAPNCEAEVVDGELWISALADINKGDELCFDYGYDIEHFLDHPCLCGSDNCVGFIVREDQRKALKRILRKARQAAKKVSEETAEQEG